MYVYTINCSQIIGYIPKYKCVFYMKQNSNLDQFFFGGSNEYPQSMFLSWNKKNNVYRCKPQLYYIKVGFKGVKFI